VFASQAAVPLLADSRKNTVADAVLREGIRDVLPLQEGGLVAPGSLRLQTGSRTQREGFLRKVVFKLETWWQLQRKRGQRSGRHGPSG
jgi:hypothetical protein